MDGREAKKRLKKVDLWTCYKFLDTSDDFPALKRACGRTTEMFQFEPETFTIWEGGLDDLQDENAIFLFSAFQETEISDIRLP
jgi:hypothetical protein